MQLNNFLPYQLSILTNTISQGIANHYRQQHDISIPEWRILAILSNLSHQSAKQLAQHSQMDKVRVSRTMKLLHEKNLVTEEICPQDARARRYNLSSHGKHLIDIIEPKALAFEQQLIACLSQQQISEFKNCMETLKQQAEKLSQEKP